MNKQLLFHIASELIVVLLTIAWFQYQNNVLNNRIKQLEEYVEHLDSRLVAYEQILNKHHVLFENLTNQKSSNNNGENKFQKPLNNNINNNNENNKSLNENKFQKPLNNNSNDFSLFNGFPTMILTDIISNSQNQQQQQQKNNNSMLISVIEENDEGGEQKNKDNEVGEEEDVQYEDENKNIDLDSLIKEELNDLN